MVKKKSRAGAVFILFIIGSALLFGLYQEQVFPMPLIIFGICFGVLVLVCIYLLMPSESKEYTIYIKRWKK